MIGAAREGAPTRERARRQTAPRGLGAWSWLLPLGLLTLLALGWQGYVRLTDQPRWFMPAPSDVAFELLRSRALLWHHTWTTLQEVLVGFALAFVLGVLLAVVIAASRVLERALFPLLIATQAVPIIALAPVLLIWFGYGMTPKVIVVVLTCFFPIAVSMVDGLRAADPDALALLRSMGASRAQLLRLVRVPAALPSLFSGLRIAAAIAVIGAIVGEWVGASSGLGYLMTRSAAKFQTPRLYAAVFIAAALGVGLFALVSVIERVALPWRRGVADEHR
jgi:putative hydroxymethylpyrimidine transport system permease protein